MSIDDDVALLERVPTLRLLGDASLRMLAIGSEQRDFVRGDVLFNLGDDADAGFVVQRGAFRVDDGAGAEMIAGPGALIGELALVVPMKRPSSAIALEHASVIRVARSLSSASRAACFSACSRATLPPPSAFATNSRFAPARSPAIS
ncbi:hypothetical protein ACVWWG_003024 [Bradyrhizobium sp. LB7.2]